jgi:hypothetical protein
VNDTPWAGADTDNRRVAGIVRKADPEHHSMVSPWVMSVVIGIVQVVVTVVVVLLIADAFEG